LQVFLNLRQSNGLVYPKGNYLVQLKVFKKTRINKSTFQVEKTENDDLPPIQVDINGLQNQTECLGQS